MLSSSKYHKEKEGKGMESNGGNILDKVTRQILELRYKRKAK